MNGDSHPSQPPGAHRRGAIVGSEDRLTEFIRAALSRAEESLDARLVVAGRPESVISERCDWLVIVPPDSTDRSRSEILNLSVKATQAWAESGSGEGQLILISSAAVYGPDHRSIEFVDEETEKRPGVRNAESDWWIEIEAKVTEAAGARKPEVLILRPPAIVGSGPGRFFDRLFHSRVAFPCAGYEPSVQVVHAESMAECVRIAYEKGLAGVYNVAPDDAVPLRSALKFLGITPIPIFWSLQRLLRPVFLRWIDGIRSSSQLGFSRHPCTISGERFARETGITLSTAHALETLKNGSSPDTSGRLPAFDPFGLNESFVQARAKTIHRFFEKVYWRVERKGFEHLPKEGPAIIVGPHRGFMPLDGVMLMHLVSKYVGRIPRFLIHPTLVKFPTQARFFRRTGGVMACQKNGDWVLDRGGMLAVFPEGIQGAFKMYRDVYNLGRFGRPDYIRWSRRYRAPIVPFVVVGVAEIFPILGRIKWNWFKKFMEWPFLPITPTFPLIPFPLPTKWHVQFLPPVDPEQAEAEARRTGEDPERLIGRQVREAIDAATSEIRAKRRSVFWGSVFKDERDGADQEPNTP